MGSAKRIVVMSDSHGNVHNLQGAVAAAGQRGRIDTFVCLGDGLRDLDEMIPLLQARNPNIQIITVRGNNDFSSRAPAEALFHVNGQRILAVHGHQYHVKLGLGRLQTAAEQRGAVIVLYGHTHCAHLHEVYGVLMINPGAVCDEFMGMDAFAEILIEEDGTIDASLVR